MLFACCMHERVLNYAPEICRPWIQVMILLRSCHMTLIEPFLPDDLSIPPCIVEVVTVLNAQVGHGVQGNSQGRHEVQGLGCHIPCWHD